MGFASKLQAAGVTPQGVAGAAAGYASGPNKPPGQGGAYPGQQQYQAYGAKPPPGQQQPPQGQYGAPPQGQYGGGAPPQGGYGGAPGGAPQGNPADAAQYKQSLQQTIQEKQIQAFYPPNSPALDQIAGRAVQQIPYLCDKWKMPREIGGDLCKLGLYDTWIYIDDSGSMAFEENGSRIDDLKEMLKMTATAAALFDDDGINLRFMNSTPPDHLISHIKSEQQVESLMPNIQFKGLTPMGTELKNKVIGPILNDARAGNLRKPQLVIIVTDGQPAGEPQNAVTDTIKTANQELSRSRYGAGAIAFSFAQVGNDVKAREFLAKLDADPTVGHLIDSTSNFENESDEMSRAVPPVNLTPQLWLIKLLLGAIDHSYDRKDEKGGSGPPPGQYGAPQQGGYPPQGQYGAPPQGGYQQQPGGYPPQGGYGGPPQQGGYPPQGGYGGPPQQGGYPPQGGYGGPPQQGGYPPQGGYGGAPPPPRY